MTLNQLEETVHKYLMIADPGIIKLICAVVVANRLPIPSVWCFIVSNSSGGKSALLNSLQEVDGIYPMDDLTPQTFISGAKAKGGKETSLLFRLPDKPIIVFKDFTVLLDKDDTSRKAIISQLRKIYDGDINKSFGTGEDIRVEIKVGMLAGTTTAIHSLTAKFAAMGERFLMYNMEQPDRVEVTLRAIRNINDFEANKMMRIAFKEYIDGLVIPEEMPKLPEDVFQELTHLSDFATKARSAVEREEYSREKNIKMIHAPEMPMRFAKQLVSIGMSLSIMNSQNGGSPDLTPMDNKILYKMALDSIPQQRKVILQQLTYVHQTTVAALSVAVALPTTSLQGVLDELVGLKVVTKSLGMGNKVLYELKPGYRALMSRFENIEMTDTVSTEGEEDTEGLINDFI